MSLLSVRRRPAIMAPGRREAASAHGHANGADASGPVPTGPLSAIEREVLDWFVDFAALLSVPASVAQIFGLLYLAGRSLPFENFVERLGISKGSASQGLRFLRGLGAVRVVSVPGDRREFYSAETSPTQLVSGFLEEKVLPQLRASTARLGRLERALAHPREKAAGRVLAQRVERLRRWSARARQFLPLVVSLSHFQS